MKLRHVLELFVKHGSKLYSTKKLFRPMFVDFKFSTLKIQLSDYLKPMENSVFQFSVFHSVKPGLSKQVLLM